MIGLSIILFIFTNLLRWAELSENTTVCSFKDYINYSDKVIIKITCCWILITFLFWIMSNFEKL